MARSGIKRAAGPLAVLFTAVVVMAACSSSSSSSTTTSSGGGGGSASGTLAAAEAATKAEYVGTSTSVDPTPRPAVKNKSVIIISAAQETKSSQIPANGALEAAQALGWKAQIYDAHLNPALNPQLVRQAISAKPDAIVLVAIDCDTAEQPLQEARAAGIAITPVYSFDCNDPHAGGAKQSLFSVITSYGPQNPNIDAFTESYGADQANYIIAKSHNTAKIIAIQDNEFTVLYWTLQGFEKQINASNGSKIVDTVNITAADLINGNAKATIQAALLNHPEATWVKSPYSSATTLALVPALQNHQGHIDVMGGEGFSDEIDYIHSGQVTATNAISSTWSGWAAIDSLNSYFLHQKPVKSGIGWTIVDATHNLPAQGQDWTPPIDFKAQYKKAWGVG